MSVHTNGNSIFLNGVVGEDPFFDCFTASDIIEVLAGFDDGDKLSIHLNSPGGIASEGAAIHALLSSRRGESHIVIEGIAASAASLIAMAGTSITMTIGSVMMIHDPSGHTFGNSADHEKTIEALEALATAYAKVYARRSGKSVQECRNVMKEETWFDPEAAVAAGFADAVSSGGAKIVAAFDYSRFRHVPQKLVALATENKWTRPVATAHQTQPPTTKDQRMTNDLAATAKAEVAVRIKAILTSPEAKDRAELAEHLAFETDLSPEQAAKLMAKAGKNASTEMNDALAFEMMRTGGVSSAEARFNGEGLNRGSSTPGTAPRGNLVASMKRRHGIK